MSTDNGTTLTFTTENWNADHVVTVTGLNDNLSDGTQSYVIRLDADNSTTDTVGYQVLILRMLRCRRPMMKTASFMVSAASGSVSESGSTATFTVKLTSQPSSQVDIPVSVSDTTEARVSTDNGTTLTFTTENWNADHVVTVTGLNDNLSDGTQSYVIRLDADNSTTDTVGYKSLDPQDVAMSTTDDEAASFMVSAASGSVSESGSTATFTVKLTSQPSSQVDIPVSVSDTTEARVSTDNGTTLTFTTENWNADHVVTVTGLNDNLSDGTQSYVIRLDADNSTTDTVGYKSLDPQDVAMSTTDDEAASFMVSAASGSVSESGSTATFTVKLTSQPSSQVDIPVSVSDTTEASVSTDNGTTLTFTTENWNADHVVTVTGLNDNLSDGTQSYVIRLDADNSTTDTVGYKSLDPQDVAMSTTDDEAASFMVSSASGSVSESGSTATFTVKLTSQPSSQVDIPVSVSDTTEASVSTDNGTTLTFTTENWNADHVVTVTGLNDNLSDGTQSYVIRLDADNSTADTVGYKSLDPQDVAMSTTDDEAASFMVSAASGSVSESGSTATFTVKLTSQPSSQVDIPVSVSDTTEARVSTDNGTTLTFTTENWNADHVVTVTGLNDNLSDGTQSYVIRLDADNSTGDTVGYKS